MIIVVDFGNYVETYPDRGESFHRPQDCPHCKAVDTFIGHGYYWRQPIDRQQSYSIRIKRWLCKSCRRTISILPSFLLRFRHYLLAVIQEVVTARFEKQASWGQIEQQCTNEQGERLPSERTIRRWCRSFAQQAPRWLAAVQQQLAKHDATLPLLDALGAVTTAGSAAEALLHGASQLLAWAKTRWDAVTDYGLNDRLRFLWHWGHAQGLGRLV
jgi:hypothetical protein